MSENVQEQTSVGLGENALNKNVEVEALQEESCYGKGCTYFYNSMRKRLLSI